MQTNQNHFEYSVKRLYNGLASLRDYQVQKAILKGQDILIKYQNQKMTIPHEEILKRGTRSNVSVKSKFSGDEYSLIDFRFNPDNKPKDNNQTELF